MLSQLVLIVAAIAFAPNHSADDPVKAREDAALREIARRILLVIDMVEDRDDRAYDLQRVASIFALVGDRKEAMATWDRAIAIVEDVPLDKTRYNNHPLTWISRGQIEGGETKAGLATLEKVLAIARACPTTVTRIYLLDEIARQQEKAGDGARARATLAEVGRMREETGDAVSLAYQRSLKPLLGKIQAGDLKGAIQHVLDETVAEGINAARDRPAKLAMIAQAAGPKDLDELAQIVSLARAINDGFFRNQTLAQIVPVQIRLGRLDDAFGTALTIDPAMDVSLESGLARRMNALLEVAQAQAKVPGHPELGRTIRSVLDDADATNNLDQRHYTYLQAAALWVSVGEIAESRRIVDRQPKGTRTDALINLGGGQAALGRVKEARATFAEALNEEEDAQRKPPDLELPDDPEAAAAMKSQSRVTRTETIANLRIQLGDLPAALALIDALPESPAKGYAVQRVAVTIASAGHADVGLAWVETLSEPKAKVDALLALSAGLIQRRETAAKQATKR